jgi:hypothetical protein
LKARTIGVDALSSLSLSAPVMLTSRKWFQASTCSIPWELLLPMEFIADDLVKAPVAVAKSYLVLELYYMLYGSKLLVLWYRYWRGEDRV